MASLYYLQPWQLLSLVFLGIVALMLAILWLDQFLAKHHTSPWVRLGVLGSIGILLFSILYLSQPWPSAILLELVLRPERYDLGIDLWLHLSLLSDPSLLIMLVVIMGIWLVVHGQQQWLVWLVACLVLCLATVFSLQQWLQVSPPASMIGRTLNFSLPSGAITGFALIAALVSMTLTRQWPDLKQNFQALAALSVALAALAKLYLGFHWLTDVLASLALSLILYVCCLACFRLLKLEQSSFRLWQGPLIWLLIITVYSHQLSFALYYKLDYIRLLS